VPSQLRVDDHIIASQGWNTVAVVTGIFCGGVGELTAIAYAGLHEPDTVYQSFADRETETRALGQAMYWGHYIGPIVETTRPLCLWAGNGLIASNAVGVRLHRGFVSAIKCPLDVWLDYGPTWVRSQPLVQVTLTDKEPLKEDGSNRWRWINWKTTNNATWELPRPVFDCLLPDVACVRVIDGPRMCGRVYNEKSDALDAVSRACLRWARSVIPPS
jgi:hypothetical protein